MRGSRIKGACCEIKKAFAVILIKRTPKAIVLLIKFFIYEASQQLLGTESLRRSFSICLLEWRLSPPLQDTTISLEIIF
jgi:hypothetical protein